MSTKKIIFAVDDEFAMRNIYKEILSKKFDLLCYETANEMLESADSIKPDLAIIDIGLVEMDGYQLCEAFKQKKGMERVPVVFVTGHDFEEDQGRAFFTGGAEYVTKPIVAKAFLTLVESLIP